MQEVELMRNGTSKSYAYTKLRKTVRVTKNEFLRNEINLAIRRRNRERANSLDSSMYKSVIAGVEKNSFGASIYACGSYLYGWDGGVANRLRLLSDAPTEAYRAADGRPMELLEFEEGKYHRMIDRIDALIDAEPFWSFTMDSREWASALAAVDAVNDKSHIIGLNFTNEYLSIESSCEDAAAVWETTAPTKGIDGVFRFDLRKASAFLKPPHWDVTLDLVDIPTESVISDIEDADEETEVDVPTESVSDIEDADEETKIDFVKALRIETFSKGYHIDALLASLGGTALVKVQD